MPLLRKDRFDKIPTPADLDDDEDVFFCSLTGEIFREYDDFFKRTILLNSLVWTCSATGKTGLTYEEALASERSVHESLEKMPDYLERPILFIATLTMRGRLDDLVNDVVNFMKERYFVNEIVEVVHNGVKRFGTVIEVNYDQQTSIFNKSPNNNSNHVQNTSSENGETSSMATNSPAQIKQPKSDECGGPASDCFKYVIEILRNKRESAPTGGGESSSDPLKRMAVYTFDGIIRRKVALTKTRCRLFLRTACELQFQRMFVVKSSIIDSYGLESIQWENLFAGPKPNFPKTPLTRKPYTRTSSPPPPPSTSNVASSTSNRKSTGKMEMNGTSAKSVQNKKLNEEQNARMMAAYEKQQQVVVVLLTEAKRYNLTIDPNIMKSFQSVSLVDEAVLNELRESLKKAREEEKEKLKEEKKRARELLVEWKKPRDDLECDDQKPLPDLVGVRIPRFLNEDEFGECLSLVEFLGSFESCLAANESLPTPVTLKYLLDALTSTEVEGGAFFELLSTLLRLVFEKQAEEDGDEINVESKEETQQDNSGELDNRYFRPFIESSTKFAENVRSTHGVSIRCLPVDAFTLSEVVRMYFMSAGYYTGVATSRFRCHRRGGYKCWDDHGLMFRIKHESIVEALRKGSIYELTPGERLKILTTLCDQLLTFSSLRTPLVEKSERLSTARWEWRQVQLVDQRCEKESMVARLTLQQQQQPIPPASPQKKQQPRSKLYERLFANDVDEETKNAAFKNVNYAELESVEEIDDVRRLQREMLIEDEKRFKAEIQRLQLECGMNLVGQDRCYRKYWMSPAAGVVFVENYWDDNSGLVCDQPTPTDKVDADLARDEGKSLAAVLRVCSGEAATCSVHGAARKEAKRWSTLPTDEEALEGFLAALNRRGFRENDLFENLTFYKSMIVDEWSGDRREETELLLIDGGKYEQATKETSALSANNFLMSSFTDSVLELEEKIYEGGLGSLKVFNRSKWRNALDNGAYEAQCESVWLSQEEKVSMVVEGADRVRQLSLALLQVACGVNKKNVKGPFNVNGAADNAALLSVDWFYVWKKSLACAATFSELHLFLETFERAVVWKKSVSHMRCRQCRRKGDTRSLIICNVCDAGFHLSCLKTGVRKSASIGDESWICMDCQRAAAASASVGQHRTVEDSYNDEWKSNSNLFDSEETTARSTPEPEPRCVECKRAMQKKKGKLVCTSCSNLYHFECANVTSASMTVASRKTWKCVNCVDADDDPPSAAASSHAAPSSDAEDSAAVGSNGLAPPPSVVVVSRTGRMVKRPISFEELNFDKKISPKSCGVVARESSSAKCTNGSFDDAPSPIFKKSRRSGGESKLHQLLSVVVRHPDAWPFMKPVNKKDAPDYYERISKPMDLETVRTKLDSGRYANEKEFVDDLRQIFKNCRIYNESFAPVFRCGESLERFIDDKIVQLKFVENNQSESKE